MEFLSQENERLTSLIQRNQRLDKKLAADPWRWCCQLVMTVDEAREEGLERKRRWPKHLDYLRDTLQVFRNEQFILVPKSRRMMITWLLAAYITHSARYNEHDANFVISEKEEKSAFFVDERCLFIENNLRLPEFRRETKTIRTKTGLVGRITYPEVSSYIWGYTASRVFVDEMEFIDEAPAIVRAVLPMIEGGAQAIFVSSSNGPTGVIAEYCRSVRFGKWKDMNMLGGEPIRYAA
jgi:hypothetical protein